MASVDSYNTIGGILKQVYSDDVFEAVPEWAIVTKQIAFSNGNLLGDKYVEPVALTGEHGVTYNRLSDGGISLADPVAMSVQQAQIDAYQMYLQVQLELAMLSRASKAGPQAVKTATSTVMKQAMLSLRRRLEMALINGGSGWGVAASSANASATSTVVTVTTAYWAPGAWSGGENMIINFFNGNTQVNASTGDFTITAVSFDNRTLTVSGVAADITSLDSTIAGNPNTLTIWPKTAKSGSTVKEITGLRLICGNSGTLFNISGATYGQWTGTSYNANGNLTKAKLGTVASRVFNKGFMGSAVCLVNPLTFNDLNDEAGPLRMFDSSYQADKGEQGFSSLVYHTPGIKLEVIASPMVPEGFAVLYSPDEFMRVGSKDIGLGIPGLDGTGIERVPGTNYLQVLLMSDQALFTPAVAHCALITGITNG